jgi:hypothetical protein
MFSENVIWFTNLRCLKACDIHFLLIIFVKLPRRKHAGIFRCKAADGKCPGTEWTPWEGFYNAATGEFSLTPPGEKAKQAPPSRRSSGECGETKKQPRKTTPNAASKKACPHKQAKDELLSAAKALNEAVTGGVDDHVRKEPEKVRQILVEQARRKKTNALKSRLALVKSDFKSERGDRLAKIRSVKKERKKRWE